REDGIVWIDQDKCIGCRYCLIACPYQSRVFCANSDKEYFPGQGLTDFEKIGKLLYPCQAGTVLKCNFCIERIDIAFGQGLELGVDREATPACVITCPTKARYFGDLDDPYSEVSILIRKLRGFQLHLDYDTNPSIYYINR
ncbi:4Fe-4S binding protein, partial [Chloroflexota bacterium]